MATNPFDFVNAINYTKQDLFEDSQITESQYPRYVIDLAMSQSADTVLFANEANMMQNAPARAHFKFYLNLVDKKKRFAKWGKIENDSRVELIMQHYNYNREKALQVVDLFTDEQIQSLEQKQYHGGRSKQRVDRD